MLVAIFNFILASVPALLFSIFTSIGIGYVTFTGLDFLITSAQNTIFSNYNNIATDALMILNIANVDTGISIILSSYVAGITIRTTMSGIKRLRVL